MSDNIDVAKYSNGADIKQSVEQDWCKLYNLELDNYNFLFDYLLNYGISNGDYSDGDISKMTVVKGDFLGRQAFLLQLNDTIIKYSYSPAQDCQVQINNLHLELDEHEGYGSWEQKLSSVELLDTSDRISNEIVDILSEHNLEFSVYRKKYYFEDSNGDSWQYQKCRGIRINTLLENQFMILR